MNQSERRIWLIQELQKEMPEYAHYPIPKTSEEQWKLLRGLFNVRKPREASEDFLKKAKPSLPHLKMWFYLSRMQKEHHLCG